MVLTEGKMTGGGLIEGYDEKSVLVGGGLYSRSKSTFVISPPPQCFIVTTQVPGNTGSQSRMLVIQYVSNEHFNPRR
jgi:hypothetical protein